MSTTTITPSTTTGANQKAIISKILVAIDGSDASMDAADYAISKEYNAGKMFIECDGRGRFGFKEIMNPEEQLERIAKLKEKGIITEEEFERKKKEILERI